MSQASFFVNLLEIKVLQNIHITFTIEDVDGKHCMEEMILWQKRSFMFVSSAGISWGS